MQQPGVDPSHCYISSHIPSEAAIFQKRAGHRRVTSPVWRAHLTAYTQPCHQSCEGDDRSRRSHGTPHFALRSHYPILPPHSSIQPHGNGTKCLTSSAQLTSPAQQSLRPLRPVIELHHSYASRIHRYSSIALSPPGKWSIMVRRPELGKPKYLV